VLIDANLHPGSLNGVPKVAKGAERVGFDGVWTSETQHDPLLPLALIAEHSARVSLGTAVAIAFARSPTTLAYTAWDLAAMSKGRFILGLGTQVRPHIERRFGMPWPSSPVGKLREQIQVIRALWTCWQDGTRLNHRGEYYKLTLMSPFFNPGPIDYPQIPIYIAGVNPGMCRLAGEIADGFQAHPFHSPEYLHQVTLPAIQEGLRKANRDQEDVMLAVVAMTATDNQQRDFVRSQIAFYASTPSYRSVMELHGWEKTADRLLELSRRGAWDEMPGLIHDEMLNTFALICDPVDLPEALQERYTGLAGRVALYQPFIPGIEDDFWSDLVGRLKQLT
jgi:probable F420-dependent oxidoreductase